MSTEKQKAANRANAMLSTGPRTEKGKNASRLNAVRHGITGQITVLSPEDREIYDRFCNEFVDSLKPETAAERQFAYDAADDKWRLNRARAIEMTINAAAKANLQDNAEEIAAEQETAPETTGPVDPLLEDARTEARVFVSDPHRHELMALYIGRIRRRLDMNMRQLRQLQNERRAEAAELRRVAEIEREEAILLARYAAATRAQLDIAPGKFGFVYSSPEIKAEARRRDLLDAARRHFRQPKSPTPIPKAA